MDYKYLILTKENGLGIVTINRPKALNALNSEVSREIYEMFCGIESDPAIRVVILTGTDKAFIAGADILEMKDKNSAEALNFLKVLRKYMDKIYDLQKPVIAAVNGFAFGGGLETALACDFIIASENAKMGLLEITLGVIPGAGGIQRLTRLIGSAKAKELIFTGDVIDAKTALAIGIVNKVFPADKLMDEAKALAARMLNKSSLALTYAKRAANTGADMSLAAGINVDETCFGLCFDTADQKEGMNAFVEKRTANFQNQ